MSEEPVVGRVRASLRGWHLFWLLVLIAIPVWLVLQPASEWLAGGWDPGVYMNQGISYAQRGVGSWSLPAFEGMVETDASLFTRLVAGRHEAYPGIPIDGETGAFAFYFYPVTPLWIAFCYLVGGIWLAFRSMAVLGLVAAILLCSGLRRWGWSWRRSAMATVLFLTQPLVLYHMHTPCSEMVELVVMAALLHVLLQPSSVWLFLVLSVGCLNRPGYMLAAATLALALAWLPAGKRAASVWARVLAATLAVVGVSIYFHFHGRDSIAKITRAFELIEISSWAFLAGAWLSLGIRSLLSGRRAVNVVRVARLCLLVLPLCAFVAAAVANPRGWRDSFNVAERLSGYTGWPLLVSGIGGLLLLLARYSRYVMRHRPRSTESESDAVAPAEDGHTFPPLTLVLLVCLVSLALPLGYKHAADLYPWATKRFLSSLPIVLALGATVGLSALGRRRRIGVPLVLLLILAVLGANVRNMWRAWESAEYEGMYARLDGLAQSIHEDDVVVADHFVWAAPLTCIFDRQVFNGEILWTDPSTERIERTREFLESLRAEGHRVLLLTTTPQGTSVFPAPFRNARHLSTEPVYQYSVMAHHRQMKTFRLRQAETHFALHEWEGEDGP